MVAHAAAEVRVADTPSRCATRRPAGTSAAAIDRSVVPVRTVVDGRRIVRPVIVRAIAIVRSRAHVNANIWTPVSERYVTGLRRCWGRKGHQRKCTGSSNQRQVSKFHELTPSIRVLRYRDHIFVCKCEKPCAVNQTIPAIARQKPNLTAPKLARHCRNLPKILGKFN